MRLDHSGDYGSNWSPKAALNYRVDDKTKVYTSVGRFYRQPTDIERYTQEEEFTSVLIDLGQDGITFFGNENYLKSEKGYSEIIGTEHIFDENTNLTANFFNTKVNDATNWTYLYGTTMQYILGSRLWPDVHTMGALPLSTGEEKRHGIELTFNKKGGDNWLYNIGYTYIKSDVKDNFLKNNNPGNILQVNVPKNNFRIGVTYQGGAWKVNLSSIIANGFDTVNNGINDYKLFNFMVWNLSSSYNLDDRATIYFKINNIFDKDYTYYWYTTTKTNVDGGKYHSPGRNFMIGATYRF